MRISDYMDKFHLRIMYPDLPKPKFYNFENSKIDMNNYINRSRPNQKIQFCKICASHYTDRVDVYHDVFDNYILTVNMIERYRSKHFGDTVYVFLKFIEKEWGVNKDLPL